MVDVDYKNLQARPCANLWLTSKFLDINIICTKTGNYFKGERSSL